MTEVNAAGNHSPVTDDSSSKKSGLNQMGTDTFLKLLVTQLRHQDPFSGGGDVEDFMGHVAQFTLLEQVTNLQKTVEEYAGNQSSLQALNLLDREVEVSKEDGERVTGIVDGVKIVGGKPILQVGGEEYPFSSVRSVTTPSLGDEDHE